MVNTSSGTFSNLLYAINRGVPAIAVSHASGRQVKWQADLPANNALAFEIADATLRLLASLSAARPKEGQLLQPGLGLNVNVPLVGEGEIKALPFRITRLGTATDYGAVFYENLAAHPLATARGVKDGDAGIAIVKGGATLPNGRSYPKDNDPLSENNVLGQRNAITVSPVQGVPEAPAAWADAVRAQLAPLLKSVEASN
jgi:5'-nucleotidase